jgi:hypothetical protein
MPKNFKNKSGIRIEAKDDKGNAKILNTHFNSLFNGKVKVDETVLEEIHQTKNSKHLNEILNAKEVNMSLISWPMIKHWGSLA